jgi:hypothetical protein
VQPLLSWHPTHNLRLNKMPLQATSGAASYDAFGGGAAAAALPTYIEDVFSCFLYTGTAASLTITNNIDLSTKGGLTWIKGRSGATGHRLTDTARGVTKSLESNSTAAEATESTGLTAFGATGFTIGADADYNTSAATYVSWTFRKQPKFFDVVTWTGSGANTTIAHSLGSVPACIIVKRTDTTAAWAVYHRSLANTEYLVLNSTAAKATGATWWNSTTPTSSVFSLGTDATVNASGGTYVAYLFAHDAGGFGLAGTDNVISCGSYTEGASATTVTLGYEPQWILTKISSSAGGWYLMDNMRGFSYTDTVSLLPNSSTSDVAFGSSYFKPTPTGFIAEPAFNGSGATIIYIAIRRGPMKVPTDATKVFAQTSRTGTGAAATISLTNRPDIALSKGVNVGGTYGIFEDRLRGNLVYSRVAATNAEFSDATLITDFNNQSVNLGIDNSFEINGSGFSYVNYYMTRAPSFVDEVCYTGTGANTTFTHNLGVVPELIIVKRRNSTGAWDSYCSALANTEYVVLNTTAAKATDATRWNSTTPTSSVFSVGTSTTTNASAGTYVAYLFATCAGVSKVGSYTGNGTTQTINCGFGAGGARFVIIKRTDATGDWYVYDTARGMTTLTDPYWNPNAVTDQTATLGSVTTVSTGFALNSTILAAINVNAGTYIFLAIA